MSDLLASPFAYEPGDEPERYELDEATSQALPLDRRDFLKYLGAGVLLLLLAEPADAQESGGGRRRGGGATPQEISAWLHVGADGIVTVYTGKTEVGQNARTSLTQAVAEGLDTLVSSIRLVMADTERTPFDAGTFGSRTTPDMFPQLRRVAAAARELLIDLAAEQWKTSRAGFRTENGKVMDRAATRIATYSELTKGQKLARTVPADTPLAPATIWKVAGTSVPKANGRDYVTGKHKYTSDLKLPGMQFGRVLRAPAPGVKSKALDTKPAESLPGVTVVRDGEFIGVTAPNSHAAGQAVAAIKAEWEAPTGVSSAQLYEHLKRTGSGSGGGGRGGNRAGSMADGLAQAEVRLQEAYPVAYIAHAPLEPRAAVAQWEDGKLTVWTGTQRPFGVRSELATAFGIPEA